MSDYSCRLCDELPAEVLARVDATRGHVDVAVRALSDIHQVSRWSLRKHRSHTAPAPGSSSRIRSLDEALKLDPVRKPTQQPTPAPRGWEPGVKREAGDLVYTLPTQTEPLHDEGDYASALGEMGMQVPDGHTLQLVEATWDPAAWHRDQPGEDAVTRPIWRYKVRPVQMLTDEDFDLDSLLAAAGTGEHLIPPAGFSYAETFLVGLADWQVGKRDAGGTEALVRRLAALGPAIVARICELQALGRNIETVVLAGLGDLVEGCAGFYPMQTFSVELDRRQQLRVVRRLLVELVKVVSSLGIRVVVTGVAGNHGENRNGAGKAFTTPGDNDDLAVLEQVAEVFALAPGYEHVSFVIPDQQLSHTLDLSGKHVVFTHGHVGSGGWKGLWTWFKEQRAHGRTTATLAVYGHYHHLHLEEDGLLAMLQAPALEGGSEYWAERHGSEARPGTVTVLVSSQGLRDLATV